MRNGVGPCFFAHHSVPLLCAAVSVGMSQRTDVEERPYHCSTSKRGQTGDDRAILTTGAIPQAGHSCKKKMVILDVNRGVNAVQTNFCCWCFFFFDLPRAAVQMSGSNVRGHATVRWGVEMRMP